MKKTVTRIIALSAVLILVCSVFTACLMGMGSNQQTNTKIDFQDKTPTNGGKLILKLGSEKIQVNTDTVIGYFYFEGADEVMLTDKEYEANVPAPAGEDGISPVGEDGKPVTVTEKRKNIAEMTAVLKDEKGNVIDPKEYTCEIITDESNRYVGYLHIISPELGSIEIDAKAFDGSAIETAKLDVIRQSLSIWDIIMLGTGLYLLFAAITGRGRLYESEFVKEGMEKKHRTIIRVTCLVVALLMIATGVVAALDGYGKLKLVNFILFGAMLVVFIAALILLRRCTDVEAKRKAQATGTAGPRKSPNAAFVFDDDEPTVDDIKATPKNDRE
ncbi:MAG: hypothetical protein IJM20_05295 [Clostridia bacterium]|nr:hypothetical protein [Clostridia bacterium]